MERRVAKFETYDKDFWKNLEKLKNTLLIFSEKSTEDDHLLCTSEDRIGVKSNASDLECSDSKADQDNKQELLEKINKVFEEFISDREIRGNATLSLPDRKTWKNTSFEKNKGIELVKNPVLKTIGRKGHDASRRIVLLQHLLTKIYNLIKTNSYKTKRELYYEDVHLFKSQSIVDSLLDDIACLLNTSKVHLHVLTTSKGCIAGILRFKDADGNYADCSEATHGVLVPNNVQGISNIQSDARFILVVEKSAVFEMLMDNNIISVFHPCIMITGKGFPDVNTRELLKKLSDNLRIPILGLFDADPYGIEIFGTYKYGSKAMAFDVKNLAVPSMRWLGLLPTDIERLNLPKESTLPLSENDRKKANHLLKLPYIQFHQQWLNEVQTMLKIDKKAEIEGLSKINPLFLPSIYLPNKIKYGGWI